MTKYIITSIDRTGKDTRGKHWFIVEKETRHYIAEFRERDGRNLYKEVQIACTALNAQDHNCQSQESK